MKKAIFTEKAPAAIGPYSQAIVFGDMVYTSGQIGLVPETMTFPGDDILKQSLQALNNLEAVLKACDASLDSTIKVTCFIKNMDDFAAFNEVYNNFFGECKPARSCVEVSELPKGALVEVEAIASVESW